MDVLYEKKEVSLEFFKGVELAKIAHLHKEFELIFVRKGKTMAFADNKSYILDEGDIFISFPNQVHYYDVVKKGEFFVLIYSAEIVYGIEKEILKSIPESNMIHTIGNDSLSQLFEEINNSQGKYKLMAINGYINVIMSIILPQLKLVTMVNDNNATLRQTLDFCVHNFKDDITLDYLSERLHLSKYYISHLINKNLSINFNQYINSLRINEACNLLKQTDMKIADISEDVGFGTIRSFNRSFAFVIGISPAEYRNRIQKLKESSLDN